MNNPDPRVAAIHDLSGFGRASLTVIIPILSSMGIQVCPVPTAVLSTHTGGFTDYAFIDLTRYLEDYIDHWKALNIQFDCVYTGFLGSPQQVGIATDFIEYFAGDDQLVVVDPVMGDDGKTYGPMDEEMVMRMREYIACADVITPNLTEAAFLLDEPYDTSLAPEKMKDWLVRLADRGPDTVIITSVPKGDVDGTYVLAYDREDGRFWRVECDYIPTSYPGTGDAFTSAVVGSLLQGDSLPISLDRSVQFITAAIRASYGYGYPEKYGVLLERVLDNLRSPVINASYELFE